MSATLEWIKQTTTFNSASDEFKPAIVSDADGNVYVAYQSTDGVAGSTDPTPGGPVNAGGVSLDGTGQAPLKPNLKMMKLNYKGDAQTGFPVVLADSANSEASPAVCLDSAGKVCVAYLDVSGGSFDVCIQRRNASGALVGSVIQSAELNTASGEFAPSIVAGAAGVLYVAYSSPAADGSSYQIAVAKIAADNSIAWVKKEASFNSNKVDEAPAIALDSDGAVLVSYQTSGAVAADGAASAGGVDIVVMKLAAADGALQWVKQNNGFNMGANDGFTRATVALNSTFASSVKADAVGGSVDPAGGEGWYYKNINTGTASTSKINWYFWLNGTTIPQENTATVGELLNGNSGMFAVATFKNVVSKPWFVMYTSLATGTKALNAVAITDANAYYNGFAQSALSFQTSATPALNTRYLLVAGNVPASVHPSLPRLTFDYIASSSNGTKGNSELMNIASFHTNSGSASGNVEFIAYSMGVTTGVSKSELILEGNNVNQVATEVLPYSVDVYADSTATVAQGADGWRVTKPAAAQPATTAQTTAAATAKINWYYWVNNAANPTTTLGSLGIKRTSGSSTYNTSDYDLSVASGGIWAVVKFNNNKIKAPYFAAYTMKETNAAGYNASLAPSADGATWFRSVGVWSGATIPADSNGKTYLMTVGNVPSYIHPDLPRLAHNLSLGGSTRGPLVGSEIIAAISLQSNSSDSVDTVDFTVSDLGVISGNVKKNFALAGPGRVLGNETQSCIAASVGGASYVAYATDAAAPGGSNAGASDIVVMKMTSAGAVSWIKQFAAANTSAAESNPRAVVDADDNVYVAYQTLGAVSGATNKGFSDIAVMKVSTAGELVWANQAAALNTAGLDILPDIAIDSAKNLYITYVTYMGTADGNTASSVHPTRDIVIAKMRQAAAPVVPASELSNVVLAAAAAVPGAPAPAPFVVQAPTGNFVSTIAPVSANSVPETTMAAGTGVASLSATNVPVGIAKVIVGAVPTAESGGQQRVIVRAYDAQGNRIENIAGIKIRIKLSGVDVPIASFIHTKSDGSTENINGIRVAANTYEITPLTNDTFDYNGVSTDPCFLADAPVLTPTGYRAISSIRAGDKVTTADGRVSEVLNVTRKLTVASAESNPYIIPASKFGAIADLEISPRHGVMVEGKGMVEARNLGLAQKKMRGEFNYYNLCLEKPTDTMVVGGVAVESMAHLKRVTVTLPQFKALLARQFKGKSSADLIRAIERLCVFNADGTVSYPSRR